MQFNLEKTQPEIEQDYLTYFKSLIYIFITETSGFPEWKQANYTDTSSFLEIQKLKGLSLTVEEQAELDHINAVRNWKNDILSKKQVIEDVILNPLSTPQEIRTAIDSMVYVTFPERPFVPPIT